MKAQSERAFQDTFRKVAVLCPGRLFHIVLPIVIPTSFANFRKRVQEELFKRRDREPRAQDVFQKENLPEPEFCSLSAFEFFSFCYTIAHGLRKQDTHYYQEFYSAMPRIARQCRCDERVLRAIDLFQDSSPDNSSLSIPEFLRMNVNQPLDVIRAGVVNGMLRKQGMDPQFQSLNEAEYEVEISKLGGEKLLKLDMSYDVDCELGGEQTSSTVHLSHYMVRPPSKFCSCESNLHMMASVLASWEYYRNGDVVDRNKLLKYVEPGMLMT